MSEDSSQTGQRILGNTNDVPPVIPIGREVAKCDHGAFLNADSQLHKSEEMRLALVKPILRRLVASFDDELVTYSPERESDLFAWDYSAVYGHISGRPPAPRMGALER